MTHDYNLFHVITNNNNLTLFFVSASLIITAPTQPYSCLDAENGAVAQKI